MKPGSRLAYRRSPRRDMRSRDAVGREGKLSLLSGSLSEGSCGTGTGAKAAG